MFIAAAAQRTRHIRLGTGGGLIALSQPVHARRPHGAARPHDAGPAMFGVGPGALVHDALKIGIDPGASAR